MAGIITGSCHNRGKLVRFGYVNVMEQTSHFLAGKPVRAHEFHYYDSDNNGESCVAVKPVGVSTFVLSVQSGICGTLCTGSTLISQREECKIT